MGAKRKRKGREVASRNIFPLFLFSLATHNKITQTQQYVALGSGRLPIFIIIADAPKVNPQED